MVKQSADGAKLGLELAKQATESVFSLSLSLSLSLSTHAHICICPASPSPEPYHSLFIPRPRWIAFDGLGISHSLGEELAEGAIAPLLATACHYWSSCCLERLSANANRQTDRQTDVSSHCHQPAWVTPLLQKRSTYTDRGRNYASLRFNRFHSKSFHFISFHFISFHFISCHLVGLV